MPQLANRNREIVYLFSKEYAIVSK